VTKWTDRLNQVIAGTAEARTPLAATLNLPRLSGWLPGRAWLQWKVDPNVFHGGGAVFGGYLAALADQAMGFAMATILEDGEVFTTSDLRFSFFRPVTEGTLHVEAQIVHRGRGMAHVEVVLTRDDGKVAGKATATQVIVQAPDADRPIAAARKRRAAETSSAEGGA
jgi:uncharacterized protein (TIGR00369 family)